MEEVAGFFSQEVFKMQEDVWGLAWERILNEDVWEKFWDSADPPSYCPNKADMPFFLLGFTSPSLPILSTLNKHLYDFRILNTMFPVSIRCFPHLHLYCYITTHLQFTAAVKWKSITITLHFKFIITGYCQYVCLHGARLCYTTSLFSEWPLLNV